LIRLELLHRRNFRTDVFTAEDQEWARWLFYCTNKAIARVSGAGMDNTRNSLAMKHGTRKRVNEYVSIAFFSNRKLLGLPNLSRVAYQVIKPTLRVSLKARLFHLLLLFCLIACHFVK